MENECSHQGLKECRKQCCYFCFGVKECTKRCELIPQNCGKKVNIHMKTTCKSNGADRKKING